MLELVRQLMLEDTTRSTAFATHCINANVAIWWELGRLFDLYVKDNNIDVNDLSLAINVTDGIYNAL